MRSLILVIAALAIGGGLAARYLPAKEAQADEAPAQISTGGAQVVRSVAIDGGRNLPYAALRSVLATKAGDALDAQRLEHDRAALAAELADRGYLAAKVAPASVTFARGGAYVVFDIEPGRMFHLRTITVTGPGRRDADVVTLAAGDEAIRERIARARQSLADTYARRGGKLVELTVRPDAAAAAVDVELATR